MEWCLLPSHSAWPHRVIRRKTINSLIVSPFSLSSMFAPLRPTKRGASHPTLTAIHPWLIKSQVLPYHPPLAVLRTDLHSPLNHGAEYVSSYDASFPIPNIRQFLSAGIRTRKSFTSSPNESGEAIYRIKPLSIVLDYAHDGEASKTSSL